MAIIKQTSFENGIVGNKATSGTADVDTIGGGSATHPQFVSDGEDGSVAIEFDATTATMYLQPASTLTEIYGRAYCKVIDSENDNRYLLTARNGGNRVGDVRREGDGTVTIRDNFTATDSTASGFMPLNTWVRFEWYVDQGGFTQELRLYKGANLHGTTADDTLTGSCNDVSGVASFGTVTTNATNQQFRVDAFAIGDDWIGPVSLSTKPKILGKLVAADS